MADNLSPRETTIAARRGTGRAVSWGRTQGRMVVEGRAHIATDDTYQATLCGVSIPSVVARFLNGEDDGGSMAGRKYWPNDADDTAKRPRCQRCQALNIPLYRKG